MDDIVSTDTCQAFWRYDVHDRGVGGFMHITRCLNADLDIEYYLKCCHSC